MSTLEAETTAPYGAPENIMRVIEKGRKSGLPPRVTPDYMVQLGIGEGMISRNLRTLEFLDLIDPFDGAPTKRFQELVVAADDEWQDVFKAALRESYDSIFRVVDPETDDRVKVLNAFRPMKPQSQWNRMVTLFLALCQAAGMNVKDAPSQRAGKDTPKDRVRIQKVKPPKAIPNVATRDPLPALPPGFHRSSKPLDPALAGIVAKIGEIETLDDLESWYEMFRAAFRFVKGIR